MTLLSSAARVSRRALAIVPLAGLLVVGLLATREVAWSSTESRAIPAPALDGAGTGELAVAVLAGGCFWGVQGVFQHVEGVANAVSGYAGGEARTANYDAVSGGDTGHAEAVRVTFDPRRISYGRVLQIYFSVAHDPTQLDRQGPDRGTQYRSAIFPQDAEQARIARAYIAQLDGARTFASAIVTKIESDRPFYPAEAYHQDFMVRNPRYPYIVVHDAPKLASLKRIFPALYRSKPVLVASAR